LGGIAASQYVQTNDPHLSDARPPTAGSSNYIQNTNTTQASTNFNISGNGTVGGALSAGTQFNIAGNHVLSISGAGQLGINSNTFAGVGTGASNTPSNLNVEGNDNSFFGFNSGKANTTGNGNSFFGFDAGLDNQTGGVNTFLGAGAGGPITTGSENTFVGMGAGDSSQTNKSGGQNTLLGFRTDVTSGVNNGTAIGANAAVTQSNSLILGSINSVNGAPDTSVGIGTTAPVFRLHVVDPGAAGLRVQTNTSGGKVASFGGFGDFQIDSNGTAGGRLLVRESGNVGIGTTNPPDFLSVHGDIRVGTLGTNGCLKNNQGGTIAGTCSSDLRFKRDITPFPNLLNKVAQLRPVHYYWRAAEFPEKHFGNAQAYGLVAQEVEQVLPELVSEDEQGYKQIDYSKLPLLLLQAVKELKAESDQLKPQQELLTRQQAEIAELKARLRTIERTLRKKSSARRR